MLPPKALKLKRRVLDDLGLQQREGGEGETPFAPLPPPPSHSKPTPLPTHLHLGDVALVEGGRRDVSGRNRSSVRPLKCVQCFRGDAHVRRELGVRQREGGENLRSMIGGGCGGEALRRGAGRGGGAHLE